MGEIKVFEKEEFGTIRVVTNEAGEPMFCLADVCKVLDLQPNKVKQRLKEDGGNTVPLMDSMGREQETYMINEANLHRVIMQSRKEEAVVFQDWICEDVLPSIRKTGSYSAQKQLPKTYLEALKELVVAVEEKERLALENKEMQPKAEYFDNLVERKLLTNMRDTAKQIHVNEKTFINLLILGKYVYEDAKKRLRPYAEYVPSLFEIKDYERNGHAGTQVLVTPKGKETFRLLWGR